ncbi:MAG: hypothetical protein ACJZ72_07320 [Opitutales bacterium]
MKTSLFILGSIILLFLFSSCSKKAQPETTLSRDGDNASGSGTSGFNDGAEDFAGLGDPPQRRFW